MYQDFGLIYPTADLQMLAEYTHLKRPRFILTLDQLVSSLGKEFTQGKRPLVAREQELILSDILQRLNKDGHLQWLLLTKEQESGMVVSIKNTLQTYMDNGISSDVLNRIAATSTSPRFHDLTLIYTEYQLYKQTNNLYELSDIYQWIFNLSEDQPLPEPLTNLKGLRAFHFYFSRPLEKRFFAWLCSRIPDCEIETTAPRGWEAFQPNDVQVLCAFDMRREIQEVLVRVKQSLVQGIPPYAWAILARSETPYFPLLREELEKAQIPYSMVLRTPLTQQPLIQAVQIFLRVAASPHRFSLTNLLRAPLMNRNATLAAELASLWPAEGLEGDWTTWFNRLKRAAERNRNLLAWPEDDEDPRPKKRYSEQFFHDAETLLLEWQNDLNSIPEKATPSEFREALMTLFSVRGFHENIIKLRKIDLPQEDLLLLEKQNQAAWQELDKALRQLEIASSVVHLDEKWVFPDYVQELSALLASGQLPIPYGQPTGVRIGAPLRMRGQHFHGVAVLGLNDGVFPAPGGNDWMLDADSLKILSQAGYSIPTPEDRAAEEEALFRSCLEMAEKQWILSYSRRDFKGQGLTSSPFLLLLQIYFSSKISVQETESSLFRIKEEHTLSEESLKQITLAYTSEPPAPEPPLIVDKTFLPKKILQSPSAYNQYQSCPYAYFLTYILRLEQPQSVETDLTPLDRGTLMHRILEALVKAWKEPLYETNPPDLVACKAMIPQVMDQFWIQPELLELSPKLWQAERLRYQRRFETWLEEEAGLYQERNAIPLYSEWKFGHDTLVQLDENCYPIQGKIDRIDFLQGEQNQYYLYDYKTGSPARYKALKKEPLNDLQLPCYGLAWEKQNHGEMHSAAYYFPGQGEGKAELVETVKPQNWPDLKEDALRILRNIDTMISRGHFPKTPKDDACDRCPYASLCRREMKP